MKKLTVLGLFALVGCAGNVGNPPAPLPPVEGHAVLQNYTLQEAGTYSMDIHCPEGETLYNLDGTPPFPGVDPGGICWIEEFNGKGWVASPNLSKYQTVGNTGFQCTDTSHYPGAVFKFNIVCGRP